MPLATFHFHFQSVFRFENSLTLILMSDPALFSVFGFELRINSLTSEVNSLLAKLSQVS